MTENLLKEYILQNAVGTIVGICNYGATVTKFCIKDKNSQLTDVTLGFKNLEDYKHNPCYFGVTVGRYANRIANGIFKLEGVIYKLDINNKPNCLHGGFNGLQNKMWLVKTVTNNSVILCHNLEDMEGGFPGNLTIEVQFTLTDNDELVINYFAKTDKTTVINLTNHTYFNLNGQTNEQCMQHLLKINAEFFTPTNKYAIPTGKLLSVNNTPFDFRNFKTIEQNIDDDNEQIIFGSGYDHNFVLTNYNETLQLAAEAIGDQSNIKLQVYTTQPGVQFYSGNYINDKALGKNNLPYGYRSGFCLETQHFPDSPNQNHFPSTVLRPGNQFTSTTIYKLSLQK